MLKRITAMALAVMLVAGCAGCARDVRPTEPSTAPSTQATTESTEGSTTEATTPSEETAPLPEPETVSILDFLTIATQPVGSTMYVWGGGWNEEDTGAGVEAVTLGISPQWSTFAALQDASYNYKDTRYQIHDGLDCSGYVGWAVYNIMETRDGNPGYVCASTQMSQALADRGLGEFIRAQDMTEWLPGDIMSMEGHCWIVAGMCDDGSVLLLHASPPGVIFCGTTLPDGSYSQAVALAERIMREQYPEWYSRWPNCSRPYSYLTDSSAMRWSDEMLDDKEGLRKMCADEVVQTIYSAY